VLAVGLVRDPGPGDPGDDEPPRGSPWPRPRWQPFAWIAVVCWLLFAGREIGGFIGYLVLLLALGIGYWRIDRWLARQYWGGLREHGS
jgi:hypothetical protein